MTAATTPAPTPVQRYGAIALAACSCLLTALILVQAALAGQHLFEGSAIALHGYLGNASFALGIVIAVLVGLTRGAPWWLLALATALLAGLFGQTGLGYVGRDTAAAAAWHIPLGVTLFGLATIMATVTVGRARRLLG